ncbi:MAG: AmmeMemoRadiSam system protein B [Phycisphaerales bacterium]|nr:AmmeMemoRadiSam system protein B [Phycisphaerales bacterium]
MPAQTISELPEHLRRPHVRPFQPIAGMNDKQQVVGLREPTNLAGQMLVVPAGVFPVITLFQGDRELADIAAQVKAPEPALIDLVQRMDAVGLIWGPTSERLERELLDRLRARGAYEIGASTAFGDTAEKAVEQMSSLLTAAEDPELGSQPLGLVAPHLDLQRGGKNYAAAYRSLNPDVKPDRIIVLGTNHFGLGDGVVGARMGFDTPLGRVETDQTLLEILGNELGDRLYKDELDHVGEHSIQLHLPWIAHLMPGVPVCGLLVPDPMRGMMSDDGARVSHEELLRALPIVLERAGGNTLVIASADLSHIGPQFGDDAPVDDARLAEVEAHDRAMLGEYCKGDAAAFIQAMTAHRNATRWCSIGNMTAALAACPGAEPTMLEYSGVVDEQRAALVTSSAIAFCN